MGIINILDIDTVNKISAGEVVERPASAIKEMVENSIDAGATKITVEIKNGGISFMRVTDNGCGIQRDDIKNAFLPHSTSKISSIEDLADLYTMGFRGEALASISSVSRVELITKTKEEELGCVTLLEGGKIISTDDAGCPDGTTIVVSDLFYNTPARMKFLKKDSTEAAHIADVIDKMILGNPHISFKFINNARVVRSSPGNGSITDAFSSVYGRDLVKDCFEINYEYQGVRVTGLAGQPYASRSNRSMEVFYVNKRAVRSKTICFAAEDAYNTMLMTGKYPILLIYIDINAAATDVNVHPSKLEIKFSDDKLIHDAVFWAVQNGLFASKEIKEVKSGKEHYVKSTYSDYNFKNPEKTAEAQQLAIKNKPPYSSENISSLKPEDLFTPAVTEFFKPSPVNIEPEPENAPPEGLSELNDVIVDIQSEEQAPFKIIGQVFDTYIIIEFENKMLLIDQHAAHERINFNRLSENKNICGQLLLCPEMINVSTLEADVLEQNMDTFRRLGFELENFGEGKYVVRQAPDDVPTDLVESVIFEIIAIINKGGDAKALWDKALFTVACKSSVKANTRLSEKELEVLVRAVLYDDRVKTCPHGRPVVISFDKKFIEKEFKRIV